MKDLMMSFVYAFRGILYCIKTERNMRIHLTCVFYMFSFLTIFDFFEVSRTEFAILLIACATVIPFELVNTALERAVDLETRERNPLAAHSKDAAAGAVLAATIFSVAAGVVILWQPAAFSQLFRYFADNLWALAVFLLSLVVACIFIFIGPIKISRSNKNK